MFLISAKNGASGKADTKIVTNPYCNTETKKSHIRMYLIKNNSFNLFHLKVSLIYDQLILKIWISINQIWFVTNEQRYNLFPKYDNI